MKKIFIVLFLVSSSTLFSFIGNAQTTVLKYEYAFIYIGPIRQELGNYLKIHFENNPEDTIFARVLKYSSPVPVFDIFAKVSHFLENKGYELVGSIETESLEPFRANFVYRRVKKD
jgi:hypothetical protein